MRALPEGVSNYASTQDFTEESIPTKLLESHRTGAGIWGRIVVLEGRLRYRVHEPEIRAFELSPGNPGIVEPEVPHEVAPMGRVRFRVDFYR